MKKPYDYECPKGHQFEIVADWDADIHPCTHPRCRQTAERIWLSRRSGYRHLETPVVIDRLPDGSYSFPGTRTAAIPSGAERIEMRTFADYHREMKKVNDHFYHRAERNREKLQEKAEIIIEQYRREAREVLAQSSDNWAKDLIREALSTYNSDRPDSAYAPIWNQAMEG